MNPLRTSPLIRIFLVALALASCGGGGGSSSGTGGTSDVYADRVVTYSGVNSLDATEEQWPYFFHPGDAAAAPGGTDDTVSLGYTVTAGYDADQGFDPTGTAALGGSMVLGLGNAAGRRCIVNGEGDDFAVFENPFATTDAEDGPGVNSELALVEVSEDNSVWYEFPHGFNDALPLVDPARYVGFAGVTLTSDGGDRFDLAEVIDVEDLPADFRACYIRLTDAGTVYADYGNTQSDLHKSGADIDAVQALHSVAAPTVDP